MSGFIRPVHDVEKLQTGDLMSLQFGVARGRCRSCKEVHSFCLSINRAHPGDAYGLSTWAIGPVARLVDGLWEGRARLLIKL